MRSTGGAADAPPRGARACLRWGAKQLGLPDLVVDVDELFRERIVRDGVRPARRWYRAQALAAVLRVRPRLRSRGAAPPGWVAAFRPEHVAREARLGFRRLARAPSTALSFAGLVGAGMAATAFMVQVRSSVLHPDLGLGGDVHLVRWIDSAGRELPWLEVSGNEAWLTDPPERVGALLPVWPLGATLASPDGLVRAAGQGVKPGFLTALGASPALGRDLAAVDEVVLSDRLWRARWGADPGVLGAVELDGRPARVVGVAPRGFDGPMCCAPPEFWVVGARDGEARPAFLAVARPRDPGAAAAWLTGAAPGESGGARADLEPARSAPYGGERGIVGRSVAALLGLAALAWAGTLLGGANLLLADTLERRAELRLRRALGSHAGHHALRTVVETAWLALLAAGVGLLAAWGLVEAAPWLLPMVGGRSAVEVALGWETVIVVGLAAGVATLACASPAIIVGVRLMGSTTPERATPRTPLLSAGLVGQVALAGTMGVVTTLLVGSIRSLDGEFVGFRHGETAAYFLTVGPHQGPASPEAVLADAGSVPGARAVALTRRLPVYGGRTDSVVLAGVAPVEAVVEEVSAGFFTVVGTDLVAGRPARRPDEVVVSADLAASYGGTPVRALGAGLRVGDSLDAVVVGVVEEATWGAGAVRPTVYRGWGRAPLAAGVLLVRPAGRGPVGVRPLMAALREHRLALEPFSTLDGLLVRSRLLSVFLTRLALVFGVLCLTVALTGFHAHFTRWVRWRTRELGIHLALGAPRSGLGLHLTRAALRLAVPGAVIGCAAGWAASRVLIAIIGEVGRPGPGALAVVATVLVALSLLALAYPLARAAAVDPVRLLRPD